MLALILLGIGVVIGLCLSGGSTASHHGGGWQPKAPPPGAPTRPPPNCGSACRPRR